MNDSFCLKLSDFVYNYQLDITHQAHLHVLISVLGHKNT